MPGTYNRQSWTRAEKLTLRMSTIDRGHMAVFTDQHGRTWSQRMVEEAERLGRMKLIQNRLRKNARGIVIGRTLTVRVRPTVRQRRAAA